tara:strand:+ start:3418 stop:4197 length:780 start_codon:yes stop_codon:yes gene_type:complete
MKIKFQKYQGTGNDFIIIDNTDLSFPSENISLIKQLCDRKFGIGCDGLILINPSNSSDYLMNYYNSDGNLGSMCGNGARCSVKFAQNLNIINDKTVFTAFDGLHNALIFEDYIMLSMKPVNEIKKYGNDLFLDTGSPHYVQLVSDIEKIDVLSQGRLIRNNSLFKNNGVNVNFVQLISNSEFSVRTYERGVENETLSCGTGVTAVALAMFELNKTSLNKLKIVTKGGDLSVEFNKTLKGYNNIKLTGMVKMVYSGEVQV